MNKLSIERQAQVLKVLVEGNSIRSTVRITGVAKNTIVRLLVEVGAACSDHQDKALRNLPCRSLRCDEIWSFVYAKEKNVPDDFKGQFGYGDVWTWTAIDPDTKLVPSWLVGNRDLAHAIVFIDDLASRLAHRVQLTTDGHKSYLEAIEGAFGADVDYAMLIKLYGQEPEGEKRYSPAKCIGTEIRPISGNPDVRHISISYSEGQNLTMRMAMRRFTRLTNGFSKKVENLAASVSLHFMYYNFARPHKTLFKPYPTTPAMAAGVSYHVWSMEEILGLLNSTNSN